MILIPPDGSFDPIAHVYMKAGKVIPSFSWVMRTEGLSNSWGSEAQAARGTAVHAACHFLARGTLDWRTVDPSLVGYLEAYQAAAEALGFEPDANACEAPLINDAYLFGVKPDQPGKIAGSLAVLEIKTISEAGPHRITERLQTAAQAMTLWPEDWVKARRIGLQIRRDGTWDAERHEDFGDADSFLNLLGAAVFKLNTGQAKLAEEER